MPGIPLSYAYITQLPTRQSNGRPAPQQIRFLKIATTGGPGEEAYQMRHNPQSSWTACEPKMQTSRSLEGGERVDLLPHT